MAEDINKTWRRWKRKKKEEDLELLLGHVDPVVQRGVDKFSGVPIPRIAIEAEAKKQAVISFGTYNPKRGASIKTHTSHRMQKLYRYVAKRQNIGTIPEHRVMKINTFKKAKEFLEELKGREPSMLELSDHLVWSPQEVSRMESELRKDLGHSLSFKDMAFIDHNRNMDVINFAYYSLSPQEQIIYDYAVGTHGKPQLKTSEIAKKMGVSPSQISKIKKNIFEKVKEHTT